MAGLDDIVKGNAVRYAPETGSGSHVDKVAPTDDDMEGRPEDAFRTRRDSHCLLIFASDGTIQWFPYPANDMGTLKGDVITLEFSAASVKIKGLNLMPLVLALADYRAASVRVAKETPGCKTAVVSIVVEER